MIIKEKRYIKKCDCGTEIIYTRRDCYHNTTWDIYSLYCPSCSHEYSYRRGTHHDLFDKEYEEDSVDKDKEIERLKEELEYTISIVEHNKTITKHLKEIERLNNIINDFEKHLIEEIEDYEKQIKYYKKNKDLRSGILDLVGEYEGEKVCFEDMLGKLQELKGSDKE